MKKVVKTPLIILLPLLGVVCVALLVMHWIESETTLIFSVYFGANIGIISRKKENQKSYYYIYPIVARTT